MTDQRTGSIRGEVTALMLLSLGGLLLHMQIHPVPVPGSPASHVNFIPFVLGLAGVIVVPFLLSREKTWLTGYLINGFSVVFGFVLMGYMMVSGWSGIPSPGAIISDGMLPSIILMFPKLMIGQRILRLYRPRGTGRMFTPLWWTRHFIYASLVFMLAKMLGGLL